MPGLLSRTQISFLEEECGSSSVHFPGQVTLLNAPTEFEHLKFSRGSHWLSVFVCTSWSRQSILLLLPSSVQLFVTPWTEARQASLSFTHCLPEFAQTHVHWVGDAIQPSHPLSLPSPPALNLSQHQGLFKWVSSLHQVAKVLELQLPTNWKESDLPMNIQGWFPLGLTGLISLQSKGLSSPLQHHSSNASILWHSAFFTVQCYIHTWLLEKQ